MEQKKLYLVYAGDKPLLYRRNSFGKERELPISHGFEADFLYIIFKEKR